MSKEYLTKWLEKTPASAHETDEGPLPEDTDWEKRKEWWEPYVFFDEADDEKIVDWLCDHLGDAQGVMEELWNEVLRLRSLVESSGGEKDSGGAKALTGYIGDHFKKVMEEAEREEELHKESGHDDGPDDVVGGDQPGPSVEEEGGYWDNAGQHHPAPLPKEVEEAMATLRRFINEDELKYKAQAALAVIRAALSAKEK